MANPTPTSDSLESIDPTALDAVSGGRVSRSMLILTVTIVACFARASPRATAAPVDETGNAAADSQQVRKERAARLEIMRRHAASLEVKVWLDGSPVAAEMIDTPFLHYNNPAGETLDATVRFANELERTHTKLLKRIQAERQRNH